MNCSADLLTWLNLQATHVTMGSAVEKTQLRLPSTFGSSSLEATQPNQLQLGPLATQRLMVST